MMSNDVVVLYHYYERSDTYKRNLIYFLERGYSTQIDYIILISGGCTVALPQLDNITYCYITNKGYDYGGYAHAINKILDIAKYNYFVFLNSSVRGPFLPSYYDHPWTQVYTSRITDEIKLVGSTINIVSETSSSSEMLKRLGLRRPSSHVQSMSFAMDRQALEFLIAKGFFDKDISADKAIVDEVDRFRRSQHAQLLSVLRTRYSAIKTYAKRQLLPSAITADQITDGQMADKLAAILHYEVMLSHLIIENGWNISCLLPEYKHIDYRKTHDEINPTSRNGDPCYAGAYFDRTLDPYEVVFIKTNRDIIDFRLLERIEASQIANAGSAASAYEFSEFDRVTSKIESAWKGHRNFALWLSKRLKPNIVVDLGVDYGFSTYCFASAGIGHVYGVDSFEGDAQAGMRDTYFLVVENLERLKLSNVTLLKGYFGAVAKSWDRPIDILHIDGLHTYEAVRSDFEAWRPFVSQSGVILLHDTCVPNFGVRRLFNEIKMSKTNLSNSCGLGVVATNPELIAEISSVFSVLVEPGTTKL